MADSTVCIGVSDPVPAGLLARLTSHLPGHWADLVQRVYPRYEYDPQRLPREFEWVCSCGKRGSVHQNMLADGSLEDIAPRLLMSWERHLDFALPPIDWRPPWRWTVPWLPIPFDWRP